MLSPEKTGLLSAFLGGLPESIALRLAKAVEVDRLSGGVLLPHETILAALRPALRLKKDSERTATPLRLFCEPFEDLLIAQQGKEKRKGRIARSSVAPMWNWISQVLMPEAAAGYAEGTKAALLGIHPGEVREYMRSFWSMVSPAMREAIAKDRKGVRAALGGDLVLADVEEIALLLSAAGEILALHDKFPRGTPQLTEDMIWVLRDVYDALVKTAPDVAPYVPVIVMSRLERPWEALKLPLHISRQTSDTLISNTDMGLAGEVLLGDLEVHSAAVKTVRHPIFEPVELAHHVKEFSRLSNGLTQEVELRRDGDWHKRLMKDRTTVADTLEGLMERAPREIVAALPVAKTGSYGGGPKAPDIKHAPDADKVERGLRYAKLVALCRPIAAAASFGAAQKDAQQEASIHLKSYSDDIVRELRTAEGPKREIAERFFNLATEFTAVLFSEEEAEFLRRRGRAALGEANQNSAAA
jgi:hypothetical protein